MSKIFDEAVLQSQFITTQYSQYLPARIVTMEPGEEYLIALATRFRMAWTIFDLSMATVSRTKSGDTIMLPPLLPVSIEPPPPPPPPVVVLLSPPLSFTNSEASGGERWIDSNGSMTNTIERARASAQNVKTASFITARTGICREMVGQ